QNNATWKSCDSVATITSITIPGLSSIRDCCVTDATICHYFRKTTVIAIVHPSGTAHRYRLQLPEKEEIQRFLEEQMRREDMLPADG
ncbi:MAG: hypothetical protein QF415_16185, partial [Candidatus Undinarchaeales archaeon]|nr:hypothetical protein [Candidatus Undinarchaeales archaeon]